MLTLMMYLLGVATGLTLRWAWRFMHKPFTRHRENGRWAKRHKILSIAEDWD